jgi:hypothetical protein
MTDDQTVLSWVLVGFVVLSVLALAGLSIVLFSDDAAAQEEASSLDVLTNADENGLLAGLRGRVEGWVNARVAWVFGEETTASDACGDLRETFVANEATIETYANNRTTAGETDVVAIRCAPTDEDIETVYLTTDIRNGSYTNTTMVETTDRTVDEECTLEEDAAVNAAAELQTFVDEFAAPDEPVAPDFRRRITAQYAGDVDCGGWMEVGA